VCFFIIIEKRFGQIGVRFVKLLIMLEIILKHNHSKVDGGLKMKQMKHSWVLAELSRR
jgi:hypothetical protein